MSNPYIYPPQVPAQYGTPPNVPSGQVWLFNGTSSWSEPHYVINTKNSNPGSQYSFVGTPGENNADWIAFNLPEGVVMTLLNNPTTPPTGEPFNFAGAGVCVDLFGNGTTQTIDLSKVGAVNCLSAFIWRKVDLSMGVFQLFDTSIPYNSQPDANTTGPRYTFFLCEWEKNVAHSLKDWAICDASDGIYFTGLNAQSVYLYDGGNGDGSKCGPYSGWFESTSTSLEGSGFTNKAGSWSWSLLFPVECYIESMTLDIPTNSQSLASATQIQQGINQGNSTIDQTVIYSASESQAITCTLTNSLTIGFQQKVSISFSQEYNEGIASEKISCNLQFSFSEKVSDTTTNTTTTTQMYTLTEQQVVHIPANSQWTASWVVQLGKVPATSFQTYGYYYYTEPVPGSTDSGRKTSSGDPLYVLKALTTGVIHGSVAVSSVVDVSTTPITSDANTDSVTG